MTTHSSSPPPSSLFELICSVCGDRADGYHFGAVSCAACGAFFRRSVSEQKLYHCLRRNCTMHFEIIKRNGACRFCRFEKCRESGMLTIQVQGKRKHRYGCFLSSMQSSSSINGEKVPTGKKQLNVHSGIEMIINLNRNMTSSVSDYQDRRPGFFTDFCSSISVQFKKFKIMMGSHSLLQNLCPLELEVIQRSCNWFDLSQDCISYDLFLTFYICEIMECTILEGGVQLDRICLPGGTHIELTFPSVLKFLSKEHQLRRFNLLTSSMWTMFTFAVRTCAKHIQSSHYDETEAALNFYTTMYVAARPGYSGPDRTLLLDILNEMCEADDNFAERYGGIVLFTQNSLDCLAQLKEVLNLVSLHQTVRWDQSTFNAKQ